jgi:probable biosynthetic protein (TIGR04098 family)
MKTNRMQLTMSHVGLGTLNECALMIMMGDAHSLYLTQGKQKSPDELVDKAGNKLYPAYYMTHLKIPPSKLLSQFKLWDDVNLAVEVKRFGETILESRYVLSNGEKISDKHWKEIEKSSIVMNANSLFVISAEVDKSSRRKVSIPVAECLADLQILKKTPSSIRKSGDIRSYGFSTKPDIKKIHNHNPIKYKIVPGKDCSPGHALIFAKFVELMDHAEFLMLTNRMKPGLSINLYNHFKVIERETYYYGNCFEGEIIDIYFTAQFQDCPLDYHGDNLQTISAGLLDCVIEIYLAKSNMLLSIAKVKKLLAIPTKHQELYQDIKRFFINSIK